MELLAERAELRTAPTSIQTDPGNNFLKQTLPGLCVVIAAAIALLLKVIIAFNTFGTNDVVSFYQFALSLHLHGLEQTYGNDIAFNHPSLVAHFLEVIYKLAQLPSFERNGITFPFLLRLPGIVADFVVVCALLALRKREPRLGIPTWTLCLLAVSPVSLMVSGFHGNTDSIMLMFLVLAACQCVRNQPISCGIFLALSYQIKIVPLLCLPVFLFFWIQRHSLLSFVLPLILTTLIFWSEPLFQYPLAYCKKRFWIRKLLGTLGNNLLAAADRLVRV